MQGDFNLEQQRKGDLGIAVIPRTPIYAADAIPLDAQCHAFWAVQRPSLANCPVCGGEERRVTSVPRDDLLLSIRA